MDGPIFTHKNIVGLVRQWYPYSTIWEQNIVVIIHIYGALAMFLLFCDHQETESKQYEMESAVDGPRFTKNNIKDSMGK